LELTRQIYRRFNDKYPKMLSDGTLGKDGSKSKKKSKAVFGSVFTEPRMMRADTGKNSPDSRPRHLKRSLFKALA
jgi:hypothetical protein